MLLRQRECVLCAETLPMVTHKFSILVNEKQIDGVVNFKMNKSGELEVEKFLNNEENWLKTINQY